MDALAGLLVIGAFLCFGLWFVRKVATMNASLPVKLGIVAVSVFAFPLGPFLCVPFIWFHESKTQTMEIANAGSNVGARQKPGLTRLIEVLAIVGALVVALGNMFSGFNAIVEAWQAFTSLQ